jgi:putative ABC transport system ATP-binding protein
MFEIKDLRFKNILNIDEAVFNRPTVCLIGPSGCGKSTLLRMLNKMEEPDSGAVFYNELNIRSISAVNLRREVTMLPQTPIVYEGNVRDNLLIGHKLQHRELPSDDKLEEALEQMYLKLKLDQDTARLSGGEKQRLCLARVILLDSPVYLLDEPSAALDPHNEKRILDQIVRWIHDQNKQLIMVTHAVELAQTYAEQLIKMDGGKIE